jgi:predicted GIY-YIG superfamily endonuclease
MAFTYILRCADDTLYVGHTENLASREQTHNDKKGAKYAAVRGPVRMVYAEEHSSAGSAIAREGQGTPRTCDHIQRKTLLAMLLARASLIVPDQPSGYAGPACRLTQQGVACVWTRGSSADKMARSRPPHERSESLC